MLKKILITTFTLSLLGLFLQQMIAYEPIQAQPLPEEEPQPEPKPENPETQDKILLVIDPGHGPFVNTDTEPIAPGSSTMKRKYGTGTVGNITGVMERDINLNVSLQLKDLLVAAGYDVVMTRVGLDEVLSNIDRVNIANDLNADLMIRIHNDSSEDTSAHGASILVPMDVGYAGPIVDISQTYAEIILDTLVSEVGMTQRGVIPRFDQTGFNWSKVPIMTVEMGFLSNAQEEQKLIQADYQKQVANALFLGIEKCFEDKEK